LANPLVSVCCVCYNHALFLKQALDSLFFQTYNYLEIIIIDDASTDTSVQEIQKWLVENDTQKFISCIFIQNTENQGVCKSFNTAFASAKGKYIIDFSLDDVFLPQKIKNQVEAFEQLPENYGVVFSNAQLIDSQGNVIGTHYPTQATDIDKASIIVPTGNIFAEILGKSFLCPPTLMVKKTVLDHLNGYDETLSYEDFDFWLRASRNYYFHYLDVCDTLFRRGVVGSHSTKFYQKSNYKGTKNLLKDTLKIFEKSYSLCKSENEYFQFAKNAFYHLRQCFFTENFELVNDYNTFFEKYKLKKSLKNHIHIFNLFVLLSKLRVRTFFLYKLYLKYIKKSTQI
jgi:glycosyltransferase involved in cell wall biosynthesis